MIFYAKVTLFEMDLFWQLDIDQDNKTCYSSTNYQTETNQMYVLAWD